jgi:hypothetical protein
MVDVLAGEYGEIRAASTAGGGTALSTTAAFIVLPFGTARIFMTPRNFTAAVVAKIAKCPYLYVVKTADDLATATDYSTQAQDGLASTDVTLSGLSTLAAGDALFVGSWMPFRGVAVDVDAPNGDASVLTVTYWDGSAWTDISATDGTDAAGDTLAVDGNVTWTIPSDWTTGRLSQLLPASAAAFAHAATPNLYWTRWEFSAALDAATTLNSMTAMAPSTTYAEWTVGVVIEERMVKGPGAWSAIEALTDAGTGNLIVNAATQSLGRFV